MRSNSTARIFALIAILGSAGSGCGLLGESVADFSSNGTSNISSGAGCMRDSVQTLGEYFSGDVGQIQINGAWNCVDESLDLFSKKVRGENPGFYTNRELGNFIETQILDPGSKLSDATLTEILRIKQLIVGGDATKLTVQELADLRIKTSELKKLFFDLQPTMKIVSGNWNPSNIPQDQALIEIRQAHDRFTAALTSDWPELKSSYALSNLQNLATSLKSDFPQTQGLKTFDDWVRKYLPLIQVGKKIVLNSSDDVLAPGDWIRLLKILPSLYGRYLDYNYFLAEKSWFWGDSLPIFKNWVADICKNLKELIANRNSLSVSQPELLQLIDSLGNSNLLPDAFGASTLKPLVPVALTRFLTTPAQRLANKKETALSTKAIENFEVEFAAFLQTQTKLDAMYTTKSSYSHLEIRTLLAGSTGSLEELSRIFQLNGSFAFDEQGRVFISTDSELPYTQTSALKLNITRALARLFIRGYAKDLNRANASISLAKDEVLVDAWTELRPVLVQAKLIEPDNVKFAKNRFLESNLFTPAGNGDAFMDFRETAGIVFYIWSGVNLSKQFHSDLESTCKVAGSNPELYNVPCVLERFRLQIPVLATNIPLMAAHLKSLPPADAIQMLNETLRATAWIPNAGNTAKLSDIDLMLHLLQYMESIYRRWDTNKDRTLNKSEAMVAEPVFRPLLAEISGQTNETVLRAAFAYILIYQKNPADDFWGFLSFMNDEASWNINVPRTKLSKVLGFIADQMAKP